LEQKFEIVLLIENARAELKRSANQSQYLPRPFEPKFANTEAELSVQ
jgi:hypothetical protein